MIYLQSSTKKCTYCGQSISSTSQLKDIYGKLICLISNFGVLNLKLLYLLWVFPQCDWIKCD